MRSSKLCLTGDLEVLVPFTMLSASVQGVKSSVLVCLTNAVPSEVCQQLSDQSVLKPVCNKAQVLKYSGGADFIKIPGKKRLIPL